MSKEPIRSLVLGAGGQDGSYLVDLLLKSGREVHGLVRRSSTDNLQRISHNLNRITLHHGDVTDSTCLCRVLRDVQPHEVYHEADQDSVGWSASAVEEQLRITTGSVASLLELVRIGHKDTKVFIPCSAHMYGDPALLPQGMPYPQDEGTPFNPQSPYACAKVAAYHLARHYRQQHGLHVSTAIFYNHDSPRRSDHYLLHKICKGALALADGSKKTLALGNLDGAVDIGYAREYMEAAIKILEYPEPRDWVIGTGVLTTVEQIVKMAFAEVGVGSPSTWRDLISIEQEFFKPTPKSFLVANAKLVMDLLGFQISWSLRDLLLLILSSLKSPTRKGV